MGDQGDVDLAQRRQAPAEHQRVGIDVVGVHLMQGHVACPTRLEVGGGLLEFVDVTRDQEKIAAFTGPQTGTGAGDGRRGTDDQDFLYGYLLHKITRLQKRDIRDGSRSASSRSQAGYA